MTPFNQRDGRVGHSPGAAVLANVMQLDASRVTESSKTLASLGMTRHWIGPKFLKEIIISHQVAVDCGTGDLPRRRALDARLFFCPDLSAEAVRLWALATISGQGAAEAQSRLGWDEELVIESGRELAAAGLAELRLGTEVVVRAKKLPSHGIRIMEFRSEDLGRTGGRFGTNTSIETAVKRIREKKRRDTNREIASQDLD